MTLNPLIILVAAVFTHNIALTYLIGMCPMLAMSRHVDTAVGMGVAVTFVLAIIGPLNWVVYRFLLVPTHSEVMAFLVFIIVIASAVQLVEMLVSRFFPALHSSFGVFLPLITVNCAILAGSLFMVERDYSVSESIVYGVASGLGWALAIVVLAAVRERLKYSDVPAGLQGLGITFVTAGLIAMAFLAFSGIQL